MDIKWAIEKLIVTGDNKLVTRVYWRVDGVDTGDVVSGSGWRDLSASESFTAYEQLTETQVLDWIWAPVTTDIVELDGTVTGTLTTHLKDDAETQLAEQLARRRADVLATPVLPWKN
jgi:hypothetical protein